MDVKEAIRQARIILQTDPHLANYSLRDCPELKAAGLDDLSWAIHRGCPHANDVFYLIEELEKYLIRQEGSDAQADA